MLPHEIPWIPLIPLLSAGLLTLAGRRMTIGAVATAACAAPFLSFLGGIAAFRHLAAGGEPLWHTAGSWIAAAEIAIDFSFQVDALAAVMILVVTGVGFLIHVYSFGYMREDPSLRRYFIYLNLFVGAMLVLVTAQSLPLLFLGWEGVGLCSYLLIGFWFSDPEKAAAGLKAFLVNKAADAAFLAGMLILAGLFATLDIPAIHAAIARGEAADGGLLRAAGLLLLAAACGKSAQIFLHVWLPDAMAGPTPVSALIHAATMVTAGAYLLARLHFLYAPDAFLMDLMTGVGTATALYAAVCAFAQTDIKKVLAYSTVSQLGILFMGLGAGAQTAAVFHLVTHAFFKALLFLAAGSVIHGLAGEQNICRMGNGLWRRMPATFLLATAGVLSATTWPFAGFASKHQVLAAAGAVHPLVGWLGETVSVLTALYLARWWLQVFFTRNDGHASAHAHESPTIMIAPMALLAVAGIGGGILSPTPGEGPLSRFLAPAFPTAFAAPEVHAAGHAGAWALSFLFPAAAAVLAWFYAKRPPLLAAARRLLSPLRAAAAEGFHIDALYRDLIVRPATSGAVLLWAFLDMLVIDGAFHAAAGLATGAGAAARRLSTGLSGRALAGALGGAALLAAILTREAWTRCGGGGP